MTNSLCDISVLGLGPMGRNLALNLRDHGARVAAFDPFPEVRQAFATRAETAGIACADSWADLAAKLAAPKVVLLMVKAGQPVDDALAALAPHLRQGAIVIDGGNSFWRDTERREREWAGRGLRFVGAGISGGEEGARRGPAIMVGGARDAWPDVARWLQPIAAKSDGAPCCDWVGPRGAGHFVKMMHNGIEYAVMQLLGEAWLLMRDGLGLDPAAIAAEFARWNKGPAASFLLEISAEVLATRDDLGPGYLIDAIADAAGQKGTGNWATIAALELGVAAPMLAEAVMARSLSGADSERRATRAAFPMQARASHKFALDDLAAAYDGAVLSAYAQGLAVLEAASVAYDWPLERARIAALWREGCILRANLLGQIPPGQGALLATPALAARVQAALPGWRRTAAFAAESGIPAPVLQSGLASLEAMSRERLWTALVQAQRDRFGAHGFERVDRKGSFHGPWSNESRSKAPEAKDGAQ